MNKTRVSYEHYLGSGIQHLIKHQSFPLSVWRVRHFLQRLKVSNHSAQRASVPAKRRDQIQGFSGMLTWIQPPESHSDLVSEEGGKRCPEIYLAWDVE